MKFIHLADLHLGKRVNGFSLIEDQREILSQILDILDAEQPQAVLIAGDIYDRPVPPEEAVSLFDHFLVELAARKLPVLAVSGNHDSAERVAFGSRLLDASGIHISPVYDGHIEPVILSDEYGPVCFYPIPFLKPGSVRACFPDEEIPDYTTALQTVVSHLELDPSRRNVALAHQFITGASLSGSEEASVGGLDEISASVFEDFDYVALGHLHGAQSVSCSWIRYAGSPLKYSFSESGQTKSVTVVELGPKGERSIRTVPLLPRRDMRRIRGNFADVLAQGQQGSDPVEDYCEITLTDENDVRNALTRLRVCYPNLMILRYDNTRTRTQWAADGAQDVENRTQLELFEELYTEQNGQPFSDDQREYVRSLIAQIWETEDETD